MANVLSAAGWDPRFVPSTAAFEEWKDALSAKRTLRPSLLGILFLLPVFAWGRFWPGQYIPLGVGLVIVGFIVTTWFTVDNYRTRTRAERRLTVEYDNWRRTQPPLSSGADSSGRFRG